MFRFGFCVLVWMVGSQVVCEASVIDASTWINELHYDNVGSDRNELIEVIAPWALPDLDQVRLTLYNGRDGMTYGRPFGLDQFQHTGDVGLFSIYVLDVSLQNGAPDGLALSYRGDVLQLLSYEGQFTASNGPAAGKLSTELGVFELPSTPRGHSLQLIGSGDSYGDFRWAGPFAASRGGINDGQRLGPATAVPEPRSLAVWAVLALLVIGTGWRRSLVCHGGVHPTPLSILAWALQQDSR